MVDKRIENAYIWYCPATDGTGQRLADALQCKRGSKKPDSSKVAMIIGWGAKTKQNINLGSMPTMNHPNKIRVNRNKLEALNEMKKAGVNVADFVTADQAEAAISAGSNPITLPLIGRTKYHQGGKGFWDCPTLSHVRHAVAEGAQYFQNLIEIADEFRLHTFKDVGVIYGVKKVQRSRDEMEDAFVRQELDKHRRAAEKNGEAFDEAVLTKVFKRQAKSWAQNGANQMVRSNRLGWKFSKVKTVAKDMEKEAVKALKALDLDFGAVDCCTDATGKVWILEVNTGPGLEESPFDAYVETFKTLVNAKLNPKSSIKRAAEKLTGLGGKTSTADKTGVSKSVKEELKMKLAFAAEAVEKAETDEDAAALDRVFSKMFGG